MSTIITENCPPRCQIVTKYNCDTFGHCFESDTGQFDTLSQCHDAVLNGFCGAPRPTDTPGPTSTPGPTPLPPNAGTNSANYRRTAAWGGYTGKVTTVGTNGGPSYYGTYDQNGNVRELIFYNTANTVTKGGSWNDNVGFMASWYSASAGVITTPRNIVSLIVNYGIYDGFRLCIAPDTNPSLSPTIDTSRFCFVGPDSIVSDKPIYNSNDINNLGAVGMSYYIGKYPVTNCEYVEFLNAVARYDITAYASPLFIVTTTQAADFTNNYGIIRNGSPAEYTFSVKPGYENKPVIAVSYLNAIRYCNWLSLGKPNVVTVASLNGSANGTTTPYHIGGSAAIPSITNLNQEHLYRLPKESEWYKAAYYDPTKAYKYNTFATQTRGSYVSSGPIISNSPSTITANSNGDGPLPITYNCP